MTKIRTTIAAVRAVRDLTGFNLRTSKTQVDAVVSLANNGNAGLMNGIHLETPKGLILMEDLETVVFSNTKPQEGK